MWQNSTAVLPPPLVSTLACFSVENVASSSSRKSAQRRVLPSSVIPPGSNQKLQQHRRQAGHKYGTSPRTSPSPSPKVHCKTSVQFTHKKERTQGDRRGDLSTSSAGDNEEKQGRPTLKNLMTGDALMSPRFWASHKCCSSTQSTCSHHDGKGIEGWNKATIRACTTKTGIIGTQNTKLSPLGSFQTLEPLGQTSRRLNICSKVW